MSHAERRVVVVGKTGNGKSSTINQVFGRTVVETTISMSSGTKECKFVNDVVEGKHLMMVDTPGLYDTETTIEVTQNEIGKILGLTVPGFHAFILVLKIGTRFTTEEFNTIDYLATMFGPEMYRRSIVLFTATDQLAYEGITFDDYIGSQIPESLKSVIKRCDHRCVGFFNHAEGSDRSVQVNQLITMIDGVMQSTGNTFYTGKPYAAVTKFVEDERIRRQAGIQKDEESVANEIRNDIQNGVGFGAAFLSFVSGIAQLLTKSLAQVLPIEQKCSIS